LNKRPILFALLSIAAYLALWILVPKARFLATGKWQMVGILIATILFIAIQVAMVRWLTAIQLRPAYVVLGLVLFVGLFALVVYVAASPFVAKLPPKFNNIPVLTKYLTIFAMRGGVWTLAASFLVILASVSLGYLLSFLLKEKNILLPVSVFAAYTDFWTVLWGPTSSVVQQAPEVVQAVSAAIPAPGAGSIQPISFIGPGDFIFMAMFFAALTRLKMEPSKTYWLLFPLLSLGMLAVLMNVFPVGLPALVLVSFAVVIVNRRHFKLQRQEIISTVIVAVVLLASAFIAYPYLTKRH